MKNRLTTAKPFNAILLFSLPMILSVTIQQLYNICDSLISGRMIGQGALAAINVTYPITMIYLAFATGFGVGANIICAKCVGMNDKAKTKECVYTALIFISILAIILGTLGFFITGPLLKLLNCNDEIYNDAYIYLRFYSAGMLFLFIYNSVASLFQALGNSKTPLFLLIFSTLLNLALDFLLVSSMKVKGIALGTFLSQMLASMLSFLILIIYVNKKFDAKTKLYNKRILFQILPIAIPSIIQASIISIGNLLIQGLINKFDTATIAGFGAAYKLCYIIVNIYTTMSNAISTFTSQNAGAKEYRRIKKGYYAGLLLCLALTIITTTVFCTIPNQLLKIFSNENSTNDVFITGKHFIYCVAPFYIFMCFKIPCDGVLKGSQDMKSFMIATFADLIVRVLLSYIFFYAFSAKYKIIGIFISWPIGWLIGMLLSQAFYISGRWKKKIGYNL